MLNSLNFKQQIRYFFNHKFIRHAAILQAGSFGGTVIQAAIGIFIARLLQPELFGIYALAFGMASIATLLIGMGIQEAVSSMLGRAYTRGDKTEIENLLGFMMKVTFYAALTVIAVSAFLPFFANLLYGNYKIGIYAGMVAVGVILSSSLFTLAYSVFQATHRVRSLSALILSDQSLRYGLSLLFVFIGWGVAGAAGGQLAGAAIVFIISVFLLKNVSLTDPLIPRLGHLIRSARTISIKKYLNFTFWVAFDRNMGNIFMALPVILTGIYVASSNVSFFKLAFGYMNIALGLLGPVSILLNVEFPRMEVEDRKRLFYQFKRVSLYSLGISFILTAGAVVVSPLAFKILYGSSFSESVKYVFGLFVYGALYGIGVGLGPMWRAINKVKISIIINLIILGFGIPLGLWLIKFYGLSGAVIMVTLWFTVSHLTSFIYIVKKLGKHTQ